MFIRLYNYLYRRISYLAKRCNDGVHPKHEIMGYHQFFKENIERNSTVLDIGCGYGELAYDLAGKAKLIHACDINKNYLSRAQKQFKKKNIEYIHADATIYNFNEVYDYILLSNVLEHIKNRIDFLLKIKRYGRNFLIRVPMINRSWLSLYQRKLGIDNRLDKSHYIEYTFDTFRDEIEAAGLKINSHEIQFGEIWAKIKKL